MALLEHHPGSAIVFYKVVSRQARMTIDGKNEVQVEFIVLHQLKYLISKLGSVTLTGKIPLVIFFPKDVMCGTLGDHINLRQFITVPTE